MNRRIPCAPPSVTRMAADSFQLTIVFTIIPVIPFCILQAHLTAGALGATTTGLMFYVGYPLTFGALVWRDQLNTGNRKEATDGTQGAADR